MGPSPATTEPSSTSPRASSLEQGVSEQTLPRARLPRVGLGRGRRASVGGAISVSPEAIQGRPRQGYILRITRGVSHKASARNLISVSREASFSVLLEAGSSAVRRPPPRPTLPTTRHVSLMLQPLQQSQPDGGSMP